MCFVQCCLKTWLKISVCGWCIGKSQVTQEPKKKVCIGFIFQNYSPLLFFFFSRLSLHKSYVLKQIGKWYLYSSFTGKSFPAFSWPQRLLQQSWKCKGDHIFLLTSLTLFPSIYGGFRPLKKKTFKNRMLKKKVEGKKKKNDQDKG